MLKGAVKAPPNNIDRDYLQMWTKNKCEKCDIRYTVISTRVDDIGAPKVTGFASVNQIHCETNVYQIV